MRATYEQIEPLVADVDRFDGGVVVTFRCPRTGVEVAGEGHYPEKGKLAKGAGLVGGRVLGSVREGVSTSVRSAIRRGVLPGAIGAAAYRASGAMYKERGDHKPGDRSEHDAVVAAFESVAESFRWDEEVGAYVGVTAGTTAPAAEGGGAAAASFADQLRLHPVSSGRDVDVLARILAAVIAGDGEIGDHERSTFAYLVPGADLDSLAALGSPSTFELAGVQAGPVRETIYLLACSAAVIDGRLGSDEAVLLATIAPGLGLDPDTANRLRRTAQRHVLDEARDALRAAGWDEASAAAELARMEEAVQWDG